MHHPRLRLPNSTPAVISNPKEPTREQTPISWRWSPAQTGHSSPISTVFAIATMLLKKSQTASLSAVIVMETAGIDCQPSITPPKPNGESCKGKMMQMATKRAPPQHNPAHHSGGTTSRNTGQSLIVTELYQSSPKYVQSRQQLLNLADNRSTIVTRTISSSHTLSYQSIVDLFHFRQSSTNHMG